MVFRDMAYPAAEMKMVDDHIVQGERHVARQEELIAWMRSRGLPTAQAESLLAEFKATLVQHLEHRARMVAIEEPSPL